MRRVPYRGQVYNLQSDCAWFISDSIITHNCRQFAIGNPTDEATNFGIACSSPEQTTYSISVLDHPNILAELAGVTPPFPGAVRLMWLYEMLQSECEVVDHLEGDAFRFYTLECLREAIARNRAREPSRAPSFAAPASRRLEALSKETGVPLSELGAFLRAKLKDLPTAVFQPNATFQGRVLGMFPTEADEQVIPRGWLTNLPAQDFTVLPEIGADMARFGSDRTTIATRAGSCLLELREIRQLDQSLVTDALQDAARVASRIRADKDPRKVPIRIDITGGLGTGPHDVLKRQGYAVEGVNASESPRDKENYPNRRSELWFAMRERARSRDLDLSRIPRDLRDRLIRELSTPKWRPDARGRKVVEPKDKIRERLGESPDLADGVNLAFAGSTKKVYRK